MVGIETDATTQKEGFYFPDAKLFKWFIQGLLLLGFSALIGAFLVAYFLLKHFGVLVVGLL